MRPKLSEGNVTSNSPRFLLDENIRVEVKQFLEAKRYSAEYASKGIKNSKLASLAKERRLTLLTRDRDFLNSDMFPPKVFSGILGFLIHPPTADKLVKALYMLLAESEEFEGKTFEVWEDGFEITE